MQAVANAKPLAAGPLPKADDTEGAAGSGTNAEAWEGNSPSSFRAPSQACDSEVTQT